MSDVSVAIGLAVGLGVGVPAIIIITIIVACAVEIRKKPAVISLPPAFLPPVSLSDVLPSIAEEESLTV